MNYPNSYVTQCLNKCLEILKTEPISGISVSDLFDKLIRYGSIEEQTLTISILGTNRSTANNKKWRRIVNQLTLEKSVKILSAKPLVVSYLELEKANEANAIH